MHGQVPGLRIADPQRAALAKSAADRKEAARGHTSSETYREARLPSQGKVAEHGSRSVLIESHIAYTDRALLLIGPGMTPEIIVEGVVTAIEILHLIMFFEAANDNAHSVPHSPNQGIRRTVRFRCRYEFSKTLQLTPSPFDFDTWQDKVRSHAFQPRKEQHVSLPARALAHNPVPQFPLRHRPSKQRYGIG